jgi:hypothetical protein
VKGRARQDRRKSCLPDQGLDSCSTDALASTSCPCSSAAPSVCGPFVRHTTVNARNSRIGSGYGVELLVDITRNSGGSVLASRGFSSAVRLSHASYATAAAVERGFVDTSIPADVVIQPSLSSLELVDVAEPLSALEVELIDENEALSHVSDLEAKLRCLRDWGLTDEELAKLRLHVPSSVRSALLKNSAKKLVEVATFLVEECGVPKLKVADALLGNVFLASSRIDDCLRPKVGLSQLFESGGNLT